MEQIIITDFCMTDQEHYNAAKRFAEIWKNRQGYEKGEAQSFWFALLRDIFGVERPEEIIDFEDRVKLNHVSFIDAIIPSTRVLIEHKSINVNPRARQKQSDGSYLTPYDQAKRYDNDLPRSEKARYIIVCNFQTFLVYDMEQSHPEPIEIHLEDLPDNWRKLQFLVEESDYRIRQEEEVSVAAGRIIGDIYDAFLQKYGEKVDDEIMRQLNVLCVRLVFCLYAEDAGLFGARPDMFHDYLAEFKPSQMRMALSELFRVLNTPAEKRHLIEDNLAVFPYVNGGLFNNDMIDIPPIDESLAELILEKASLDLDWSKISPTIFGAMFESTLNPETRKKAGMHYTSIENIHRVIDPLFLNDLTKELNQIINLKEGVKRNRLLNDFTERLSELTFLDPACGSGNFLTETYLSLRRLENRALRAMLKNAPVLDVDRFIKVNIGQFYGIEINDFAVTVARTALWIAQAQTLKETERIVNCEIDLFPLKDYANIVEANALTIDWNNVVASHRLNYIIGNPPFIGARTKTPSQLAELTALFGEKHKGVGELDYVCGWYRKAADYMAGTDIRAALVSTNSITQGEQVAPLWKSLWSGAYPAHIDFAWSTFRWDSEVSDKAHVHVVIIGFSCGERRSPKIIYSVDSKPECVNNINPYIIDASDIVIESRSKPLCNVPPMGIGNKPIDGGNYLFTLEEMQRFIVSEPAAEQYFRPWFGAEEFINGRRRYCLWLGDCTPAQLRSMPMAMKRVEAVRDFRLKSKSAGTRKLAERPTRFHVENMPDSDYLVIPETSSNNYVYIPMTPVKAQSALCSNAIRIIPNITLYHFGILTSRIHNLWVHTVCGRLKSDPRYSKDVVYNNFPWPDADDKTKDVIMNAAQKVLDTRAMFGDSSLADLYHPLTMPAELREAHRRLDREVARAYGLSADATALEVLSLLFRKYEALVGPAANVAVNKN